MENVITIFRPCGECTACCDGQLIGDSYGNKFGNNKACIFLINHCCSVYETRPDTCKRYQCAWSQSLFDADMRPDKIGLMVSVEIINNERVLKAIEIWEIVPYESYKRVGDWAQKLNVKLIKVSYRHEHNIHN
jgi:hypothetical protein